MPLVISFKGLLSVGQLRSTLRNANNSCPRGPSRGPRTTGSLTAPSAHVSRWGQDSCLDWPHLPGWPPRQDLPAAGFFALTSSTFLLHVLEWAPVRVTRPSRPQATFPGRGTGWHTPRLPLAHAASPGSELWHLTSRPNQVCLRSLPVPQFTHLEKRVPQWPWGLMRAGRGCRQRRVLWLLHRPPPLFLDRCGSRPAARPASRPPSSQTSPDPEIPPPHHCTLVAPAACRRPLGAHVPVPACPSGAQCARRLGLAGRPGAVGTGAVGDGVRGRGRVMSDRQNHLRVPGRVDGMTSVCPRSRMTATAVSTSDRGFRPRAAQRPRGDASFCE